MAGAVAGIALLAACQNSALLAAKSCLRRDQVERARPLLERAARQQPDNAEVFFLLGALAADRGEYAVMDTAFRRSWRLDTRFHESIAEIRRQFWTVEYSYGIEKLRQHPPRYRQASRAFGRAIIVDPRPVEPWTHLAYSYAMMDSTEAALELYRHVLASLPGARSALNGLGSLQFRLGAYQEAARTWERLARLDTLAVDARIDCGTAFQRGGRMDRAEHCFREAIRLDSACVPAYWHLGNLLWLTHRRREAAQVYQQAQKLSAVSTDSGRSDDDPVKSRNAARRMETAMVTLLELACSAPGDSVIWRPVRQLCATRGVPPEHCARHVCQEQRYGGGVWLWRSPD